MTWALLQKLPPNVSLSLADVDIYARPVGKAGKSCLTSPQAPIGVLDKWNTRHHRLREFEAQMNRQKKLEIVGARALYQTPKPPQRRTSVAAIAEQQRAVVTDYLHMAVRSFPDQ
jgi:hypothetical protein